MSRASTAWIDPTSIAPGYLINREEQRDELLHLLHDHIQLGKRSRQFLVSGERGVGKSILTHWVLDALRRREGLPPKTPPVIPVVVEGRSLRYRSALKALALALASALEGQNHLPLARWIADLRLLANNDRITRSQVDEITTTFGSGASVEVGRPSLIAKITANFSWSRGQKVGTTIEQQQAVDETLLHTAIESTLRHVHDTTDWFLVVFYDDLDQLSDDPSQLEEAFKRFLALQPCIALLHLRSEWLGANQRREVDDEITLPELSAADLEKLIRHRHDAAGLGAAGLQDKATWQAFARLARLTGNPLVYLRWCQGLLKSQPYPVRSDWATPAGLYDLTRRGTITGGNEEGLRRLALQVDALTPEGPWFDRAALLAAGVSEAEFADHLRAGMLIPQSHYDQPTRYRLDPQLDLLRPSIAARI